MVIAKYIGDLLFDYECVVVPGLGGFIINDRPSKINYNTDYFTPPFREVMFNPYLVTNDGLLVNYVAKEEEITYQEAKHRIDHFVLACHQALKEGKRIRFVKVGVIFKDENGKILFEQDESINYNPDSFGLPSFISPAVRKPSVTEKFQKAAKQEKEKPVVKKPETVNKREDRKPVPGHHAEKQKVVIPRKRSPYRAQMIFVLFLIIGMLIGWGFMNKPIVEDYYTRYSDKIPVFYDNSGSYLANNAYLLPAEKLKKALSDLMIFNWVANKSEKEKEDKSVSLKNDDFTFETEEEKEAATVMEKEEESITPTVKETANPETEPILADNPPENSAGLDKEEPETYYPYDEKKNEEAESVETVVKKPQEKTVETRETTKEPNQELVQEYRYYLIAGSFKNRHNANVLVDKLREQGFPAVIAGENAYGMVRVSYGGYSSRAQALSQLQKIRETVNSSAWLMRKN